MLKKALQFLFVFLFIEEINIYKKWIGNISERTIFV